MAAEEIAQLRAALAALEAQRPVLGDAIVETALAPLREKLAALTRAAPAEEERKRVSVLFADLVGFTAMSETLDPEEVHAIMDAYFGVMTPAITRYGGTVEKYIGDAIMAVFGAPQALENHEEAAVRAALAMHEALATLNERLTAERGVRLAIRIGVNTGLVLFGAMGGRASADFAAVGDTVNLAARLQAACPVGRVLVSAETARPLHAIFDFESPQQLTVKGKAEPVFAHVVVGERAERGRVRGVAGLDAPMVGRDAELAVLQAAFEQCVIDRCWQAVAIVGEAGIGKTRLRREFAAWIARAWPQARLLTGRCYSHTQTTPYHLLAALMRSLFRLSPEVGVESALAQLDARLAALDPAADATEQRYRLGSLAGVLGLPLPDDPLAGLPPEQRRNRTFLSLERLFLTAAAAAPLLIIAEDLHWADALSLSFVGRLVQAIGRGEVCAHAGLVLVLSRPVEATDAAIGKAAASADLAQLLAELAQPPHRTLVLQPLSADQSSRLVTDLLDEARLPAELLALILERSQGNPFFVEEILRSFIDDGTLARDAAGGWQMARPLAEVTVPDTVQGVLAARLDRLPADDKRVIQRAAIVGRTFWQHLLAALAVETPAAEADLAAAVDAALSRLELRQLVRRLSQSQISDDWEWLFRHVLTQEVAYASVPRTVRRRVHAQVAAWLEAHGGEQAPALVPLIAYHYDRGNVPEKAVVYQRRAGKLAAAQYANEPAVAYFSRALELCPQDDLGGRYDLLAARVGVYDLMGAREAQARDLDALAELAQRLQDGRRQAEVARCRASYAFALADYAACIAAAQQAVALARAAGADDVEAAGQLFWGRGLLRQADYPAARTQLTVARDLARTAASPAVEADSLRSLGVACDLQGAYAEARAYQEEALHCYRAIGDHRGEAHSLNSLGLVGIDQGDYDSGQGYFERFLRLCCEIGDRVGESMALGNLGLVAMEKGDYAAARTRQEEALQLCRTIGARYGVSSALANLGVIALRLGRYTDARGYLEEALALYRAAGDRQGDSETLTYLALLQHHLGDDAAAEETSQQALAIAAEIGARGLEANALMSRGHAALALASLDAADVIYQRALEIRHALGQPNLAMEALAGLARVAVAQGAVARATAMVEEILRHLENGRLEGVEEPALVWLTCYQVLRLTCDPRAAELLAAAKAQLDKRAGRISDPEMRQWFLENIAAHRAVRQAG